MKPKTEIEKQKIAYRQGYLSIVSNVLLFGLKMWAGIASGSVALISDAWHSLSDSASSVAVIIGAKISAKPADEEHPFGHGRAEIIATLIIGVMLALISFNFLMESISRISHGEEANFGVFAIVITSITIFIKEAAAQYAFWGYRQTGFLSLKADGWHHRSDAVSSVVILIGIFVSDYFPQIDGFLGLIVAALIGHASYKIITGAADSLLGKAPNKEVLEKLVLVAETAAGFPLYLHHIHIHAYGGHTEITFHINLPADMKIVESSLIVKKIEQAIKLDLNYEATIRTEPIVNT